MPINDEENYFWNKIVSCVPDPEDENCYLVKLSCGHESILVIKPQGGSLPCAQCVHEFVAGYREKAEPIP